jgi:alpha-1,3-rhamnosyl/mannosyltransferase
MSTISRYRGIGNYAYSLANAFVGADLHGLDLQLLIGRYLNTRLVPLGDGPPTPEEAGASGRPLASRTYHAVKQTIVRARLMQAKPALYHAPDPKATPRPCRTVVTCHDLIPTVLAGPYLAPWVPRPVSAALDTLRYRLPDHVIAISDWTRRDVQRITGLPDERVSVIHHGIDFEAFHPRALAGEREAVRHAVGERPFFLYVGGFDARKQVPEMVQAFAERASEIDENLVICGRVPAQERARMERAVRASGASSRLVQLGFVAPELLPALYRAATAHVMPSTYEGFGMTLSEAFATGCPVIAADASCVPEIAAGSALLVPPEDMPALGSAMVRVAGSEALRRDLRERGLARAAHFTWERCAEQTVAVYRKVLGRLP